jgi:hypothetical protein
MVCLGRQSVLAGPVNGDLSSTQAVVSPTGVPSAGVRIIVGNQVQRVLPGMLVTPAEALAVNQIVTSGKQTILLSALGAARGGTVALGSTGGSEFGNLVIPSGVRALANFSATNQFAVAGDLTNFGRMYAYSGATAANHAGTIAAQNINNQVGALIASVIPATLARSINASHAAFDLELHAANNLINHGTIESSGNLRLNANEILNQRATDGTGGLIKAGGDIAISNASGNSLIIRGADGTITAPGKIQVSVQPFPDSPVGSLPQLKLVGGNYLSRELEIDGTADGTVLASLGEVTGDVSLTASCAKFGAATATLKFASMNVSGDPTYYNTQGSLSLPALVTISTSGQDLAILASGNVTVGSVDTTSNQLGHKAGDVTIVAGASLSTSDLSTTGNFDSLTTVTVNGPSVTGGTINTGFVSASGTNNSAAGGNVLMVAYEGTTSGSGHINLNSFVRAQGTPSGDVTFFAGASSGSATAISLPGGQWITGNHVNFFNATPTGTISVLNGTITSGALQCGTLQPVSFGNGTVDLFFVLAADISIRTAGDVVALYNNNAPFGVIDFGSRLDIVASNPIQFSGNVTGGDVSVKTSSASVPASISQTGGQISVHDLTLVSGTDISLNNLVAGKADLTAAGSISLATTDATGDLSVIAGKNLNVFGSLTAGGAITLTAGSGGTGNLQLAPGIAVNSGGSIVISTLDTSAGTITIGAGTAISAAGLVAVFVGNPSTPVLGSAPLGTTGSESNSGKIFYGANGYISGTGINVSANVNDVIFGIQNLGSSAISIGDAVSMSSGAGGSPVIAITSLDLTDPLAVARLVDLQGAYSNVVGGNLVVDGSGKATGGNLLLSSSVTLPFLVSHNVPSGVSIVFDDFNSGSKLNHFIDGSSYSSSVIIAGQEEFQYSSAGSSATFNINSALPGNSLSVSGSLSSGGTLAIAATGNIAVGGSIATAGDLILSTSANSATSINLTGSLISAGLLKLSATGGGVQVQSTGTMSGPDVNLTAGTIVQSGMINASHSVSVEGSDAVNLGNVTSPTINVRALLSSVTLSGIIDASSNNGPGGVINIFSKDIVFISGSAVKADAGGGNYRGGGISFIAGTLVSNSSSAVGVSANASGNGNGGSVIIGLTDQINGNLSVGSGAGDLSVSATGGSPGSVGGNGGAIQLLSGHDLVIDTTGLHAEPKGDVGSGANISLNGGAFSPSQGTGSLTINGDLRVDAASVGNAGDIHLAVGPNGFQVTGSISANAVHGDAGSIYLWQTRGAPTYKEMVLTIGGAPAGANFISGTVTADSQFGKGGHLDLRLSNLTLNNSISATGDAGSSYGTFGVYTNLAVAGTGSINALIENTGPGNASIESSLTSVLRIGDIQYNFPYLTAFEARQTNGGSIEFYGSAFGAGDLTLATNGSGTITQITGSAIAVNSLFVFADTGQISLMSGENAFAGLTVGSAGSINAFTKAGLVLRASSQLAGVDVDVRSDGQMSVAALNINGNVTLVAPVIFMGPYQHMTIGGDLYLESSSVSGSADVVVAGDLKFNSITPQSLSVSYLQLTANGPGGISFNSGTGNLNVSTLTITGPINANGAGIIIGVTGKDLLGYNASPTLTLGQITSTGTIFLRTPGMIVNNGTVTTTGTIALQSSDLHGNGTYSATGGITVGDGSIDVFFSDQPKFVGDLTVNAPGHTIMANFGALVFDQGNMTLICAQLANPNGFFATGTKSINAVVEQTDSFTIVNPYGDVVLTPNTVVNARGLDVAIIASGNVIAKGTRLINLSSSVGNGGNLSIFAGFDVNPVLSIPPYQSVDQKSLLTITGPSVTGGNIQLSGVSINTSSTGAIGNAGAINLFATKGPNGNVAGIVSVGNLTATGAHGYGGNVTMSGSGGIVVAGNIKTTGRGFGGDIRMVAGVPGLGSGAQIASGQVITPPFLDILPFAGSGASVIVKGKILTTARVDVNLNADGGSLRIDASGPISLREVNVSAQYQAGAITLSSLESYVQVQGSLIANGFSVGNSRTEYDAGSGGNVSISAANIILIKGKIITAGGDNYSGRWGGGAGAVTLVVPDANHVGDITVTGYIDATGGSVSTRGAGSGGPGGHVTIDAGSVRVLGARYTDHGLASIDARAGLNAPNEFFDGTVTINTYSTQSVPSNLDLPSNEATEYALPGGLFTIGEKVVVNGTAKGILTSLGFMQTERFTDSKSLNSISITAGSGSFDLGTRSGTTTVGAVQPGTLNRQLITPAQAVAIVQLESQQQQTLLLNDEGSATGTIAQPSAVQLPQAYLPLSFSSLIVAVSDIHGGDPSAIGMGFIGPSPVLNLDLYGRIHLQGTISFPSSGAAGWINLGNKPLSVPAFATIQSAFDSTVIISCSSFVNEGTVLGNVLFAQRSMTLSNHGLAPSLGIYGIPRAGTVNIDSSGFGSDVTFSSMPLPTAFYGLNGSLDDPLHNGSLVVNLNHNAKTSPINVGGTWSGKSFVLHDLSGLGLAVAGFDVRASGTVGITSTKDLLLNGSFVSEHANVFATGQAISANFLTMWAKTGVSLNGSTSITSNHSWLATSGGTISVESAGPIAIAGRMDAGGFIQFPHNLLDHDPSIPGNVRVKSGSGGVQLWFGNEIYTNRGNITVVANGNGDISIGGGPGLSCCYERMIATNGSIALLASGSVYSTGMCCSYITQVIQAAKGDRAGSGVITITAGTTNPALGAYVTRSADGTRPLPGLYGTYADGDPTTGAILTQVDGTLNLNNAGFFLGSHSGVAFKATAGHSIDIQWLELATGAEEFADDNDFVVDAESDEFEFNTTTIVHAPSRD